MVYWELNALVFGIGLATQPFWLGISYVLSTSFTGAVAQSLSTEFGIVYSLKAFCGFIPYGTVITQSHVPPATCVLGPHVTGDFCLSTSGMLVCMRTLCKSAECQAFPSLGVDLLYFSLLFFTRVRQVSPPAGSRWIRPSATLLKSQAALAFVIALFKPCLITRVPRASPPSSLTTGAIFIGMLSLHCMHATIMAFALRYRYRHPRHQQTALWCPFQTPAYLSRRIGALPFWFLRSKGPPDRGRISPAFVSLTTFVRRQRFSRL